MSSKNVSLKENDIELSSSLHQELYDKFSHLLAKLKKQFGKRSRHEELSSQPKRHLSTDGKSPCCKPLKSKGVDSECDIKTKDHVDEQNYTEFNPLLFGHESSDSSDECSDSYSRCLHESIPYNKSSRDDNYQNCTCSSSVKSKWAIHNVFKGEKAIPRCDPLSNNHEKLRCYSFSVSPLVNFQTKFPTRIKHDGDTYEFKGYFLLSHFSLRMIPNFSFFMYKRKYLMEFKRESMPKNFKIKELELFHQLVFEGFFEIFDWNLKGEPGGCRLFHFLPRFVLSHSGRRSSHERRRDELLPMTAVLEYLVSSHRPLVKYRHLKSRSRSDWNESGLAEENSLVVFPGKSPCCIRLDGLALERRSRLYEEYPLVLHDARSAALTSSGRRFQRLKRKKSNLLYFQEDCVLPNKDMTSKLQNIEDEMGDIRDRDSSKSSIVKISSEGCYKTGLKTDVFQHSIFVYVAVNHIRYQRSLDELEQRIKYSFKDRRTLEKSLRLVSLPNKITNFSSIMISSFNCGLHEISFGDGSEAEGFTRKRGLENLQGAMTKLAESKDRPSTVCHNESLEFLGDAILEFITSKHLFFMFGRMTEGELSKFRSLLVENAHLAIIAKRLEIEDFILLGHDDWKPAKLDHVLANCVEAILAAIYLDGGYESAEQFVASILFEEKDLQQVWTNLPRHILQERAPEGDRLLINDSPRLQQLVKLEEQLGLQFTHISLLARAFTCQADDDDALTRGDNERLEYLGDSVVKFIVSDLVFRHFPDHQEGHLTLLRTSLVNAQTQATVFSELGLEKFIDDRSISMMQRNYKFYANFFEAFLAAVYVDKGMEYCVKMCKVVLFPRLETFILNRNWIDPKSELQNCCSYKRSEKNRLENPVYKVLETIGPIPYRKYKAAVYFKDEQIGVGLGGTIKAAEVAAARNALESNYFEVAEKQKRVLHRKYVKKRRRSPDGDHLEHTPVGDQPDNDDDGGGGDDGGDDNEWSPKWIDI